MLKWEDLLTYKEIPPIYWMTLVYQISEKTEFWPIYLIPLNRGGGGCVQNTCYHATAFPIPLNLIWNMTIFWKWNFAPLSPNPGSGGWGWSAANFCDSF